MADKKYHCIICGVLTDNRVCWDCHRKFSKPCTRCGKPTPTITRTGKHARNTTCIACTAALKAYTRRIGITCKVCDKRYPACQDHEFEVCPECRAIMTTCPICGNPMPKYRKRGALRKTCSNRCRKLLHPMTSEQRRKAVISRRANHGIYKSHQDRRARGSIEYKQWRQAVFERDDYTCQDCGDHNYKGRKQTLRLHPHHEKPFATYPESRYDISNGVTLCTKCHRKRHKHVFIGRTHKRVLDLSSPSISGDKH